MKAFIGLGNPGSTYVMTRHNVGFLCIDALHDAFSFPSFSKKFLSAYSKGMIDGHECHLLKPQTYMNLSGDAVLKLVSFFKLKPTDVCVIHDDLDLDPGKVRLKRGGGAGGHNGLKNLDQKIGSDYWRLRIGIGRPKKSHQPAADFVLQSFDAEDETWLVPLLQRTVEFLPLLFGEDPHKFTSQLNNG